MLRRKVVANIIRMGLTRQASRPHVPVAQRQGSVQRMVARASHPCGTSVAAPTRRRDASAIVGSAKQNQDIRSRAHPEGIEFFRDSYSTPRPPRHPKFVAHSTKPRRVRLNIAAALPAFQSRAPHSTNRSFTANGLPCSQARRGTPVARASQGGCHRRSGARSRSSPIFLNIIAHLFTRHVTFFALRTTSITGEVEKAVQVGSIGIVGADLRPGRVSEQGPTPDQPAALFAPRSLRRCRRVRAGGRRA